MPLSKARQLENAIESRNVKEVERLVDEIVQTDEAKKFLSDSNHHYLMLATETGKADIIKLLIQAGADINQLDEDGWTVLIYAALEGYLDIVKFLVEAGADVNFETPSGEYALYAAASNGQQQVFDYLSPLTEPELKQVAEQYLVEALPIRQLSNRKMR